MELLTLIREGGKGREVGGVRKGREKAAILSPSYPESRREGSGNFASYYLTV